MTGRAMRMIEGNISLIATLLLVLPLSASASEPADTHHFPRIGQCYATRIAAVTHRLEDPRTNPPTPDNNSGTALQFTNGHWMVSYDTVPHVADWQRGEPIRLCVVGLPRHCPSGDYRGITYRATNISRRDVWTADNAEHGCGGG